MRSEWRSGTRRTGEVLEVRDRWQGLFGPSGWLPWLLFTSAAISILAVIMTDGCTRLAGLVVAVLCIPLAPYAALRFYPVVRFGPDTIQWRNWFRFKEIPTASVKLLVIENYNPRAWVPVVAATLDRNVAGRRRARFVATFSYRPRIAEVITREIRSWADQRAIPSDLQPERMFWRYNDPGRIAR